MKTFLIGQWTWWVKEYGGSTDMAPLTYMERTMHGNLKKEGLDVPFQKNIKMDMMAGLDEPPLVSPTHGGPGITM